MSVWRFDIGALTLMDTKIMNNHDNCLQIEYINGDINSCNFITVNKNDNNKINIWNYKHKTRQLFLEDKIEMENKGQLIKDVKFKINHMLLVILL